METFNDDMKYIAMVAGLGHIAADMRESANGVRLNAAPHKEGDRTHVYFDQLNYERRFKLYQLYKYDFEFFDYSPDDYML